MTNKKTIIRFFLIYLCVLLPLFGTNVYIIRNFLNNVRAEEEVKLSQQLYETVDLIKENFIDYRNKSVVLFENKEFSSNLRLAEATKVKEAARLLKSLRMFDENENEILVYYGEQELYTSDGMVRLNTFFGQTLGCSPKGVSDAIDTVRMEQYSVRALQGNSGLAYVLFHIPVGKDIYGYSRSMEVILNVSKLEKMITSNLHNDNLIVELNIGGDKSWFYHVDQKCQLLSEKAVNEKLEKYSNEPLEFECKELGLTVSLWYDLKTQLTGYYKLKNINLSLFTLGLFFSVAFSLVLSMMRLSRLKELLDNILRKNESNKEKKSWRKNEFDYIQMAVNETIKEHNAVREKEYQYRRVLLSQVATLIFHGIIKERKEIQAVLKVCSTELYEEYFFVFGLKMNTHEQVEKIDELLQTDIHYISKDKKMVFVLYELPFFDYDMKKRHELAENLLEILKIHGIVCKDVAMSKVYSNISMANYAYLEASCILESGTDKKRSIQCWEEWIRCNGGIEIWAENNQLKYFHEAVKQRDEQKALEILKQTLILESEKDKLRNLFYKFIQALVLEIDASEENDKMDLVHELNNVDVNDEWGFVESISLIISKYCSSQEHIGQFADVIQFVENNFANYELSLVIVAEHAGLSKSKTSRLFKTYTGESYIDYVTRLRMEKAKELLEETDLSVKEILQQVGYLDITNASKKFKTYYQINPSAYRAQIRKEKDDINE